MLGRLRHDDDGFSLVETVVAMLVFAVLATSVASVVMRTFGVTRSNTARVAAANLASQELETVRALRAVDVPTGSVTVTPKPVVNGIEYTVTRTAKYVPVDSSSSACSGSGSSAVVKLAYKLVTVEVTWPGRGSVRPVRQDTLLSSGVEVNGPQGSLGAAAVAVTGGAAQPMSGVTVTISPGGTAVTTGSDGCAVFTGLTPGTAYTVVVDQPGWVAPSGLQRHVTPAFGVTASGVTRVPLPYDRAGTLAVTVAGVSGFPHPPSVGLTLASSNFFGAEQGYPDCSGTSTSPFLCVSGTPRTTTKLFPGTYGAWTGSCLDSRPAVPVQSVVTAAASTSVTVPAAALRVHVKRNGNPATGYTAYALKASDGVCLARSWPLSPAGASTQEIALPLGLWTIALNSTGAIGDNAPAWPVVTLTESGTIHTVDVAVP